MRETSKLREKRIRDNLKRNKIKCGHSSKNILEECKYSQIETRRENKEKLLKIPNKLMFSK